MPTLLSVNVNKIATLRNARGGDIPNLIAVCKHVLALGVHGITVHPRPDERHIRQRDCEEISRLFKTSKQEFNIEGNPKFSSFIDLVLKIKPHQVTLVPDNNQQLTSDHGWDTINEKTYLSKVVSLFKSEGIRTSIFIDPKPELIKAAADTGTDRVELYTEAYATHFSLNPLQAVSPYTKTAEEATKLGLGINAGHDLSLENLSFFVRHVPMVKEVSIGHALISDALFLGLEHTIERYLIALNT